jgi:hypothetical protein
MLRFAQTSANATLIDDLAAGRAPGLVSIHPGPDERRYARRLDVSRHETGRLSLGTGTVEGAAADVLPPPRR